MNRRSLLAASAFFARPIWAKNELPLARTFLGEAKWRKIVSLAQKENWSSLAIHERIIRSALELKGTPYVGFTLEIDDSIESPSVNFNGLDCWTFFETALGLARMLKQQKTAYTPEDLLKEIEWTRYRHGKCHGHYLDRIHYLDEWFRDNEKRGNVKNITRQIGPVVPLKGRKIDEMTVLWKSYRYLRHNPELRLGMAKIEAELQQHPFHYIPKANVAEVEAQLQNGDIIGIVTHKQHVYCSHVGLALRTQDGVTRLMHASATQKRVIIDDSISGYLTNFRSHAGIVVARPQ